MPAAEILLNVDGCTEFPDSPDAGDPTCLCSKCAQVIGAPENDPLWNTHNEDECNGCAACEIPIRVWRELNGEIVGEYRFHRACYEALPRSTMRRRIF